MSHFQYEVTLTGGKLKAGQITAKTEALARKQLAGQYQIVEWKYIREKAVTTRSPAKPSPAKTPPPKEPPAPKVTIPAKPEPAPNTISAKASTRLDKLLYLQSSECFFCGRVLTKAEASVEHLWPKSKGGTDADGNVVACCVTLNRTFGSMELKEKVRFILQQKGDFICPPS